MVPRHSWLGSPGRGSGCFRGWGFPVLCVRTWCGVCAWCLCWCVWCVFLVSVLVVVRVLVCLPRAFVCVCVCACVVCWWRVVPGPCFLRLLLLLVKVWLVCAVVGPSPLLAEVPVCDSTPLLAGFRCWWWWVFLATPGSGCRVRLPATPVRGPPAVVVRGSPPLLAGACRLRWGVSCVGVSLVFGVCGLYGYARWPCCVVCCVFVVSVLLVSWCGCVAWMCLPGTLVCVVACVWGAGGPCFVVPAPFVPGLRLVFMWVWLVCGSGPRPLLAEEPGSCAPPLLAGVRRCLVVVGPLPLPAEGFGCGAPPLLAGVRRRVRPLVPRHSWLSAVGLVPRHSWLGSTGSGGGGPLATPGCGPQGALPLGPGVCVCVLCGASCWCGWGAGVWLPCVCVYACGVWFVGCVIPWLVLVVGWHGRGQKAEEKQKKRSCRCVAEMRDMRNANYIPLYLSHRAFFPL